MSKVKDASLACLLVSVLLLLLQTITPVGAAGETFTMTVTPGWITEGNPAGATSTLTVSNAQFSPPVTYAFNWTVTDPSGKGFSVTNSTLSRSASWSETARFPGGFTGGSLDLVGNYTVNVAEIIPSLNASVARVRFQTAITNSSSYQRTSVVSVTGSGYIPSDSVTISLTQGTIPTQGFPVSRPASLSGIVSFSWTTFPNTTIGTYNISLIGTNTPAKSPRDSQLFKLLPTTTIINSIKSVSNTVLRSQVVQFKFNSTYADGLPVATGTAGLQISEPGGLGIHMINAAYDSTQRIFNASYPTNLSSTTGIWAVIVPAGSFDDGYGNTGPLSVVTGNFIVQPATLAISIQPFSFTFSAGSTVAISSQVLAPSGQALTQGTISAKFTFGTSTIVGSIPLIYDQTQGRWTGSYKIGQSDPSGTWLLTITAQDAYGNSGQSSSSLNVNTPGPPAAPPSQWATWTWLIPVLAALLVGFGILIFRLRKGIHREVKLDLQAIHRKAEEVKSDNFLLSIQQQLKRRADKMEQEKEKQKSD